MEINNLKSLSPYIRINNSDEFYFLQIIQRRKENPDLPVCDRIIKTYYTTSYEQLEERFSSIQKLCKFYNARAYIDLNRKSFKKVAFLTLKKVTDCLISETYQSVSSVYNSACGQTSTDAEKLWIVDIDTEDAHIIENVIHHIELCSSKLNTKTEKIGANVIDIIKTINGCHLITIPFNVKEFEPFQCKQPTDIHKSGTTLLYYGKDEILE